MSQGMCHLCHLVIIDYQINADAPRGLSSISFDSKDQWGPHWGGSALTCTVFFSFKHNKAGLVLAAASCLCSYCPVPLQPTHFLLLLCLVPPCPLPIYFLLPLTFHSSRACLLSEDRLLHGSPPHVQCDQYKGQGPCTRTPSLTKREGLKAGETVWLWHVPVRACLRGCVQAHVHVCRHNMCVPAWGCSIKNVTFQNLWINGVVIFAGWNE